MGYDTEESVVSELTLFVDNDRDLYERHAVPIFTNLVTKMARGVYDHARAVQAFSYLAEAGAKKYAREHGGGEREWHLIFPIAVRRKAAEAWAKSFEGEAELGNYDRLLPKKYQKPAPAPASSRTKHSRAYTDGYNLASDASSNLSEAELEHIVATYGHRPSTASTRSHPTSRAGTSPGCGRCSTPCEETESTSERIH